MAKFEKVSRFADVEIPMPERATTDSAGYDLCVAEDIVLKPYEWLSTSMKDALFEAGRFKDDFFGFGHPLTLTEIAQQTKQLKMTVPLVSTGMKVQLGLGQYLELTVRSSLPLKHWIIMANGVGIIDRDYYNNSSNEGEIFLPLINLAPFAIKLRHGDKIAQGIIKRFDLTENDAASGLRMGGLGSTS